MDAKPPSQPRSDSKATSQRTPPKAALAEILLVDGSAVRPRPWRPAGKLPRTPSVDALDFMLRPRAANERRRQP